MIKLARRAALVFVTTLFSLTGANAASGNSVDLLKYISADTPYAFASTEALPTELADNIEPTVDEILKAYQGILRYVIAEQAGKMSVEEDGAEEAERFSGVAEEFLDLMSLEGIRGAGIERDSAFALYGNGLLPVLRLELSKSKSFDSAIQRIEEKADEPMLVGEVKGKEYKYIDADKIKFIVATLEDQAIITVVPSSFDESQIARALGVSLPSKSLKESKTLTAIGKDYGFSEYLIGFIDNERLAAIFTGKGSDFDKELAAAFGDESDEPTTEVCSAEIMEIAGIAPRIVMGYSELTAEQIQSELVVELRSDIANGLSTIPAAVPGLGIDTDAFLSFGFGFDLMALRAFYESRLDAMEADPYECEDLAMLGYGAEKGRELLEQPLPPVVYSFKGFVANITDIECANKTCDSPPKSIDASLVLAIENAQALLMMAAMMDPQIAALNLLPDGKPVRADLPKLNEVAENAYAAMSDSALSISVGTDAESTAAKLLVADASEPAPFMSMSMDSERYYSMVADAMSVVPTPEVGEGEAMPEEIRAAMREVMVLSGSLYKRMLLDVQFTKRGVEIGALMKMGDE